MATSEVAICNSALIKLGAEPITSLSDDNRNARLCNEQYSKMRDELLASHPWNFAITRVALSPLEDAPAFYFDKYYGIPNECLRVIDIDSEDAEFQLEHYNGQRVLACSLTEVYIKYIAQITNTQLFSRFFDDALAWRIAKELAYAITQSVDVFNMTRSQYEISLSEARSFDAQEGYITQVKASRYIDIRR